MADLVGAEARPFVRAAERGELAPARAGEALVVLERAVSSTRRLGLGAVAVALALVAAVLLAAAVDGLPLAALPGLAGLAAAAALGAVVVRDGRRVLRAYVAWCAASPTPPPRRSVLARLLGGRSLLRSALAAAGVVGAVFTLSLVYLGLSPADPADLGDGQRPLVALGAVSAPAFLVAAWCAVVGELRAGRAHARRLR